MSGLSFTPDPSSSLPDTTLSAAGVGPHLAGGTAADAAAPSIAHISFILGIEANAAVFLFNSPDDEDPDGVLGAAPAAPPGFERLALPPGVPFTTDRAWLKYRVAADAKVSAGGAVAPVTFKVDGKAGVVFADYHAHRRDERLRQAVAATIAGGRLRTLARVDDALELNVGDALVYQVRGELTSSVTLSWSDILATVGVSVARVLGPGQTLGVTMASGATAKFDVGLVDDFRLVVTKGAVRDVRVSLAKGSSRDVTAAAAAGVTVKFTDEREAAAVLQRLHEAVAGRPVAAVDAALAKASLDALSPTERKLVGQLAERLGIAELATQLDAVKERWDAVKQRVAHTLAEVARSKVELGFAYEYRRTATNDTLLVVELSKDEFRRFHGDLMLCELRPLLTWLERADAAKALVSYLHQRTLKRSRAWGFTLGIGPWRIAGRDKEELGAIVQTTRRGGETLARHAYLGMRGYQATMFGNSCEWVVDFRAEQPQFLKAETITAAHFDYGLHLRLRWDEKKLAKEELREFLDYAVIWRIVSMRGAREIEAELQDALKKKRAEVAVALTIPDKALRSLLRLLALASVEDVGARALAKAMPYVPDYDARRHPLVREACYAPLWRYYLDNPSLPIDAYGPMAERAIRKMTQLEDEAALATREGGVWGGRPAYQDLYTFAGQIYSNGSTVHGDHSDIARCWRAHAEGLLALRRAIEEGASHEVVKGAYTLLAPFWSQWLYVRAAGACLMDLAATDPTVFVQVERTCTVAIDGGEVRHYSSAA